LVPGVLSELQEEGFYKGQELAGKIIIKESLTPFNEKQPEKDLKIAGDTGVICTVDGNPIYRKTVYSQDANTADTFVKHDNVDEIRAAQQVMTETLNEAQGRF